MSWGAMLWFGGSTLGQVLSELTQRYVFPGGPFPAWRRLRRTRCRESHEGGSASWTALFDSSWDSASGSLAPRIPKGFLNLQSGHEAALVERSLQEKRPSTRSVLLCLRADLAAHRGDREEARQLITEAEDIISLVWEPHLIQARYVYELVLRMKALFFYQEGQTDAASSALTQVEKLFGWREWVILAKAEVALLTEQTRMSHALADQILGNLSRQASGTAPGLEYSALLLKAESFLREQDTDGLDWTLRKLQPLSTPNPMDRATYLRARVELSILRNDLSSAWRPVTGLHNSLGAHPGHMGIARVYHLCCARLHQLEEHYPESHQRLQLAENASLYPLAHWEAEILLASILESEDREAEAHAIWAQLARNCGETYFGRLARARLTRHESRPLASSQIFEILFPR